MTSPSWATVLKPRIWDQGCRHLGLFEPDVTIFGQEGVTLGGHWLDLTLNLRTQAPSHSQGSHTLKYTVCLLNNGTMIYNMSISLCWRRPNTGDRDYKLIKKPFTDVTNQVKSRVIFSYAYIKPSFFKPGPLVIPLIGDRSFPTKCMLNSVIYIFVGRYSMIEFKTLIKTFSSKIPNQSGLARTTVYSNVG